MDRLFDDAELVVEAPVFREPRRRKGAAAGSARDARFLNEYPPDWKRCRGCGGAGKRMVLSSRRLAHDESWPEWLAWLERHPRHDLVSGNIFHPLECGKGCLDDAPTEVCPDCLGMGKLSARVRLEAGHRCVRCKHPFMPKQDAKMLGVERSGHPWSACDERCEHGGPVKITTPDDELIVQKDDSRSIIMVLESEPDVLAVEAFFRILTVHHLDGDKANCRWWNLAALCQRCHLEIQAKVVMERVYPFPHSEWFKPYVAGYYAFVYLCQHCGLPEESPVHSEPAQEPGVVMETTGVGPTFLPGHVFEPGRELTREQVEGRMDELLALELAS